MAALFLVFAVGQALASAPASAPPSGVAEWLQVGAAVVMVGGALAGWRWERAGAAALLGGAVLFNGVESASAGRLDVVWFTAPFALAGVLYLVGACRQTVGERTARP